MATIASATEKLRRKSGSMATNFDASKGRAVQNYGSGVARFIGQQPSGPILQAYQTGMAAAVYRAPDPDKWARNYISKMTGG